jgi:hypothetical protein
MAQIGSAIMYTMSSSTSRRLFLATSMSAGAFGLAAAKAAEGLGLVAAPSGGGEGDGVEIRPFRFKAPEDELTDLRWRVSATR